MLPAVFVSASFDAEPGREDIEQDVRADVIDGGEAADERCEGWPKAESHMPCSE